MSEEKEESDPFRLFMLIFGACMLTIIVGIIGNVAMDWYKLIHCGCPK